MKLEPGRVAAVTGAASGIGRALALDLAGRGLHVALCDVDESGLAATVGRCEGLGVKVTSSVVDVADRDAVIVWADSVAADHGAVNLAVNNAGIALGATVASMSGDDLRRVMEVDFFGVVHGTQAFLPHLRAAGTGHVVNISSVFGLISVPSQSAYNAAKFAVRGFTDALRMELDIERCGVSSTTVHPGGVRTDIARNAKLDRTAASLSGGKDPVAEFDKVARTTPERAARTILRAVESDRRRVLVGADAHVIDLVSRLPAGLYQGLVVRTVRRRR